VAGNLKNGGKISANENSVFESGGGFSFLNYQMSPICNLKNAEKHLQYVNFLLFCRVYSLIL
jgi:hypothetical protein